MESVQCVVAGAGVVGLAIARALGEAGQEVLLLEKANAFGTGISSRNSEVIHAGIYYAAGTLMAKFCVAGRRALYAYCGSRPMPFRQCGKLIVAASVEELPQLHAIAAHARNNGVEDIAILTKKEAARFEPSLACEGALLLASTGIIDSHAYMLSLLADAEAAGASLATNSPLLAAKAVDKGFEILAGGGDAYAFRCTTLINAAGLDAPAVAASIEGLDMRHIPVPYYAKGSYFALTGRAPFSRLIYPVPVPGGLGVHLTLDLAGRARFGPDIEWVAERDYNVDTRRAEGFYAAIRRYWPGLADGALSADYAGIRPKIVPPSVAKQDFRIDGPEVHNVPGLINLFGIEFPGLTASLAIADHVKNIATRALQ